MKLQFTVPGRPVPKERPRRVKCGLLDEGAHEDINRWVRYVMTHSKCRCP